MLDYKYSNILDFYKYYNIKQNIPYYPLEGDGVQYLLALNKNDIYIVNKIIKDGHTIDFINNYNYDGPDDCVIELDINGKHIIKPKISKYEFNTIQI